MPSVVDSVRLEYQEGARTPVASPRVSWVTVSDVAGWRQTAAELSWNDGATTTNASVDGDTSVLVAWPFAPLAPHQRGTLTVRVQGPDGWSEWSEGHEVVAAFLGEGEWHAPFVGLADPARHAQPVLLRTEFEVAPGLERATLYATAHGVYQAYVNAAEVDDQILKPGWTTYQSRLVHETTDVTSLLVAGTQRPRRRARWWLVHRDLRVPGERPPVLRRAARVRRAAQTRVRRRDQRLGRDRPGLDRDR